MNKFALLNLNFFHKIDQSKKLRDKNQVALPRIFLGPLIRIRKKLQIPLSIFRKYRIRIRILLQGQIRTADPKHGR